MDLFRAEVDLGTKLEAGRLLVLECLWLESLENVDNRCTVETVHERW